MKTRLTTLLWACAAIVGAALLSGCTKSSFSLFGGKQIRFATVSGGAATKTAYGDDGTVDGVTMQALDWEDGDLITIASPQAEVQNVGGHASNYVVTVISTGVKSKGKVANEGSNGLAWLEEDPDGGYDFYGIYPKAMDAAGEDGRFINVNATSGVVTATLPAGQTNEVSTETKSVGEGEDAITYTIYEPDMGLAYMSAATSLAESTDEAVSLEFYPAFTAFEFNVSSKDEDVEILSIQLVADDSDTNVGLSGTYTVNAGELTDNNKASLSTLNKTATLNLATTETEGEGESAVTTTTGVKVTKTAGASFTLFTAPVSNTKALKLRVTSKDEKGTKTSWVMLTYATAGTDIDATTTHEAGDPVVFEAGHKYRINMLKLDGNKWKYAIDLGGHVLKWIYSEESTVFSENVQAKAFSIEGALENLESYYNSEAVITLYGKSTQNNYEAYDTGTNTDFKTYEEWVALGSGQAAYNSAHSTYYQLYYQKRRMNMNVTNKHFEVQFTPMAPLGGYWFLTAEPAPSFGNTAQGGPEGFVIKLWDGESNLDNWSTGQIMNQTITLNIYPSETRDPRKEYCMLIKAYFSPNKNGEPVYSADSEIQDVHGDGRYSYWKFIIPATE